MTIRPISNITPRAPRFTEIMTSPLAQQQSELQQSREMAAKSPAQTAGCSKQNEVKPVIVVDSPVESPVKSRAESSPQSALKSAAASSEKTSNKESVVQSPKEVRMLSPKKFDQSSPAKSVVEEPAKNSTKASASRATAGSSRPTMGKGLSKSNSKLPSFTSTMYGDDLDIAFGSLPLRPEMKPICGNRKGRRCAYVPKDERDECELYICEGCNNRPICRRCIAEKVTNPSRPHKAEHRMRPWQPKMSVQFDKFLWERRHGARIHFGPREILGREWMYSDHSFAPSSIGNLTARFSLCPDPGVYRLSVGVQTCVSASVVSKDSLGKSKYASVKSGATWIGSLAVGVRTISPRTPGPIKEMNPCLGGLPEKVVEVRVKQGSHNDEEISPPEPIEVLEGERLEVSIRHWHDKTIFTKRSPFKWWLESIVAEPMVDKETLAFGDESE